MGFVECFHSLHLEISDPERQIYDTLRIKTARHPLEESDYLVARILALVHSYRPGIAFSQGYFNTKEPAIWHHDEIGALLSWIEVGTIDIEKLRRAVRHGGECSVRVYLWRADDIGRVLTLVHGVPEAWIEKIEWYALPEELIKSLAGELTSKIRISYTVVDQTVYLNWNESSAVLEVRRFSPRG